MEAAKAKRTTAKSNLTRAVNALERSIETPTPIRTIERRFDEMRNRWNSVQDAHEEYIYTLDDDAQKENEQPWIDELMERFESTEIKIDTYLENIAKEANKGEENVVVVNEGVRIEPATRNST